MQKSSGMFKLYFVKKINLCQFNVSPNQASDLRFPLTKYTWCTQQFIPMSQLTC